MIPVFRPWYDDAEVEAVRAVLDSRWVGQGPRVAELERRFAALVEAEHAIAVSSGTAALHLACLALGLGAGDEVIVPTLTFVATAHAVRYCGAEPVFADIDRETLNLDVEDLKRCLTEHTKAIVAVHYGGHACLMDEIWRIAAEHELRVIEDAAHACGSTYCGRPIGGLTSTDCTCFSFFATKTIAVGDGGMVTTNDAELAQRIRRLRWMGIDRSSWERMGEGRMGDSPGAVAAAPVHDGHHGRDLSAAAASAPVAGGDDARTATAVAAPAPVDERDDVRQDWQYAVTDLGMKYQMNDIAAAIGLEQLRKLPAGNARRRYLCERYTEAFAHIDSLSTPVERDYTRSSCHNYVIRTPDRDGMHVHLRRHGIASSVHYTPLHLQPYYHSQSQHPRPVAESVWRRLLTLPLFPELSDADQDAVIQAVLSFRPTSGERR